jgi:hypothetical protein
VEKEARNAIERATQRARKLLEEDFEAQLEGEFDVHRTGEVAEKAGAHLSAQQSYQRERIVAAIEHKRAGGMSPPDAVADYIRDAAFTTLNRFAALKMLEARELTQECVSKGEQSSGYREFSGMAPGLPLLPNSYGYRLYIESLFDELSTEVKVLFDRRDPASVLWPKRGTFELLLGVLNAEDLKVVWIEDETLGWFYQFFNSPDERRKMREESQAPRNSRELAVRNQFFTPRYVVKFLTDNTLGRIWYEMCSTKTSLASKCEYMVQKPKEEFSLRGKKDPRDLRVLDPACGSGHFLLYAFDLLVTIYEEAYTDAESTKSFVTGKTLAEDYPNYNEFQMAIPALILEHNLYGVDIDPRCVQLASFALWLCAQRTWSDIGVARSVRPRIDRSRIILAEPMPGDDILVQMFAAQIDGPLLVDLFEKTVDGFKLAGDLGLLLKVEKTLENAIEEAKSEGRKGHLFGPRGVAGDYWQAIERRLVDELARFVAAEPGRDRERRRMFRNDSAHCLALLETARTKFDVVLMNPPFGQGSVRAKKDFDKAYSRTKNDIYTAFVERGIELLSSRGRVGAITSRTGFFLSSFQKWREDVLLKEAPPVVVADLGYGVLDSAMVETAAYCLEALR